MKRFVLRAVVLAVFLSALLANTIYADVTDARMSDTPGGAEMTQYASGISVVYVVIDYSDMQNEEIRVRVYDNVGEVLFEGSKVYTGSGTDSVEISLAGGGAFPDGRYVTNLYSGLFLMKTIYWDVTAGAGTATSTPTPVPATATATSVPSTPTPTPIPATATATSVPPTLTPVSGTPYPEPPTPTPVSETPYPELPTPTSTMAPPTPTPTSAPPTPTLGPGQPTPTPMPPTLAPTPAQPMATEVSLTPTLVTGTSTPTLMPATPEATGSEPSTPSPTLTTVLPTPTTALTPTPTPPTATSDTTEGTRNFLVVAGYVGVAVVLVSLALFLWQRGSS